MGLVFPEKGGTYMTVAYGNLLVAGPYGFPPARERRENEKGLQANGYPLKEAEGAGKPADAVGTTVGQGQEL